MAHVEVELKFPLQNPDIVRTTLGKIAKQVAQQIFQRDTYYNHPQRDFLKERPVREWLRVRETEHGASVNHKLWRTGSGKTVACGELETSIGDAGVFKSVMEQLGFKELVVVEKRRSTWSCGDVEIALDEVTGLGIFIELEAKGTFQDVPEAERSLRSALAKLGANVAEQDFKGYPYLLLERQGHSF